WEVTCAPSSDPVRGVRNWFRFGNKLLDNVTVVTVPEYYNVVLPLDLRTELHEVFVLLENPELVLLPGIFLVHFDEKLALEAVVDGFVDLPRQNVEVVGKFCRTVFCNAYFFRPHCMNYVRTDLKVARTCHHYVAKPGRCNCVEVPIARCNRACQEIRLANELRNKRSEEHTSE